MSWIKKVHELMKKTGKPMREVFAMIPGSMTHYRNEIRSLLKDSPPAFLGAHKYSYIEDVLIEQPNQVVIECTDSDYNQKYYLAELKSGDEGLTWGEGKEIEFSVVTQHKNEMAEMASFVESAPAPSEVFHEVSDATIDYNESTQSATVNIAQRADTINRNNRMYPKEVLKRAVQEAKEFISAHGSLPIETLHGEVRDVNSVCAVVKQIDFDEATGVVSLPEVRILSGTTSGKNILAILEAGEKLQVSQRGVGVSHQETDESTGKTYNKMDYISFQGFDMVWNGEASVMDTDFKLVSMPEHVGGSPTLESVTQLLSNSKTGDVTADQIQVALKGIVGTELAPLRKELESALEAVENQRTSFARTQFVQQGSEYINNELANLGRFTDKQKELIKGRLNLETLSESYDGSDATAISRIIKTPFEKELEQMDTVIADMKKEGYHLPDGNPGSRYINRYGGVTYEDVMRDAPFDGDIFTKVGEAAIKQITRGNEKEWVMPMNHDGMDILAEIMDKHTAENYSAIQNEAQQAGVGVPVSITSMYIVYVAWRLTSAFQVCQMHMMKNLLENIPVEVWAGQQSNLPETDRFMAVNPGESQDIAESVLSYRNYPLGAAYQPQHTRVTPYAMAVTKNTVMDPVARSIALPSRELRNITDKMLWDIAIMETLKFEAVQVSTVETKTRQSSNQTYALAGPILPYEWVIIKDDNENVTSVGLMKLFPNNGAGTVPSANAEILSQIPLEVGDGTQTYLYNTDYTVDFVKGEITLTTAGAAKLTGGESLQVKYTRPTNMHVWDANPAEGVSFENHLLGFQRVLADNKADIVDRHYTPECLCWNYRVQEKLALSARFTQDGSNTAHSLDMMNTITKMQGLKPVWSTAIMPEYAIVQQNMATLYGVHTPFTMTGSQITDNTGDERWFAKQFVGAGVPEPRKLSIVGISNLDQL